MRLKKHSFSDLVNDSKFTLLLFLLVIVGISTYLIFYDKGDEQINLPDTGVREDIHDFVKYGEIKQKYAPGEMVVKFKKGTSKSKKEAVLKSLKFDDLKKSEIKDDVYKVTSEQLEAYEMKESSLQNESLGVTREKYVAMKTMSTQSVVEYVEPVILYNTHKVPDDGRYNEQWTHQLTEIEQAWDVTQGNEDIVIAVIDSGIDLNHPDLDANIWKNTDEIPGNGKDDDSNGYIDDVNGYDFVNYDCGCCAQGEDCLNEDNDPSDFGGHGTHCSGIVAADNNNLGIVGVCPDCTIMPLRASFDTEYWGGALTNDAVYKSIKYATDNGADIINMSFGGAEPSQLVEDALKEAYSKGVILIASAGNSNSDIVNYPAGYNEVISVSATNQDDQLSDYSSYGFSVDISAPGGDIFNGVLSTVPTSGGAITDATGYKRARGTSMASPYVAGVVGLMLSQESSLSSSQVRERLHQSTDRMDSVFYAGRGRINVNKALNYPSDIQAEISDPKMQHTLDGKVDIIGRAGSDDFEKYLLSYGKGFYPESFKTFFTCEEADTCNFPINGVLYEGLSPVEIPNGYSTIKLSVYNNQGDVLEDTVVVYSQKGSITNPQRYDIYRIGETIEIKGEFNVELDSVSVEFGYGNNPSEWNTQGVTLLDDLNQLAEWDTTGLENSGYYTLKIKTQSTDGEGEVYVQDVYLDGDLKKGWPRHIEINPLYPEITPPTIFVNTLNINNNPAEEVIVVGSRMLNVNVFSSEGELLWKKKFNNDELTYVYPAVDDIDNDGEYEIVIHKEDMDDITNNEFVILNARTGIVEKRKQTPEKMLYAMSVIDLDFDGKSEIVTTEKNKVSIFSSDLELTNTFDPEGDFYLDYGFLHNSSHPAFGDFDNDKNLEIVLLTDSDNPDIVFDPKLYFINEAVLGVYNENGTQVSGWPIVFREGSPGTSPVVADIDQDGSQDVVVALNFAAPYKEGQNPPGGIYALNNNGEILDNWPQLLGKRFRGELTVGDLYEGGQLEVLANYYFVENETPTSQVFIIGEDGNVIPAIKKPTNNPIQNFLTKLTGDQMLALINGYSSHHYLDKKIDDSRGVYAWEGGTDLIKDFPKLVENTIEIPLNISDMDKDEKIEILSASSKDQRFEKIDRETGFMWDHKNRASIYVWDLEEEYYEQKTPWKSLRHDLQNTGTYEYVPNLEVRLNTDEKLVESGQNIIVTMEIKNSGYSKATDVVLNSEVPNTLEVLDVNSSIGECGYIDNNIVCNFGNLIFNESINVVMEATVVERTEEYIMGADVSCREEEMHLKNNSDILTLEAVEQAALDLSLEYSDDKDPIKFGEQIKHTAVIYNNGSQTVEEALFYLAIEEIEQANIIDVETASGNCEFYSNSTFVECYYNELEPGFSETIRINIASRAKDSISTYASFFGNTKENNEEDNYYVETTSVVPSDEVCGNSLDDDFDGFVDCDDYDCSADSQSGCCETGEVCNGACTEYPEGEADCVCCNGTCYEAGYICAEEPEQEDSTKDILLLVKENLADRLGVSVEKILVESKDYTVWENDCLGIEGEDCGSKPVPGYIILLEYDEAVYEYHTDIESNFVYVGVDINEQPEQEDEPKDVEEEKEEEQENNNNNTEDPEESQEEKSEEDQKNQKDKPVEEERIHFEKGEEVSQDFKVVKDGKLSYIAVKVAGEGEIQIQISENGKLLGRGFKVIDNKVVDWVYVQIMDHEGNKLRMDKNLKYSMLLSIAEGSIEGTMVKVQNDDKETSIIKEDKTEETFEGQDIDMKVLAEEDSSENSEVEGNKGVETGNISLVVILAIGLLFIVFIFAILYYLKK